MPPTTVDEDRPQPFKAERGASQGAVRNPTTWLAFFDILLVALSFSDVKEDNLILPGLPEKLTYTHNPAYVDDSITQSVTIESLQRIADILSAFCIIFEVDIAIQKLRSYVAGWSSTSQSNTTSPQEIRDSTGGAAPNINKTGRHSAEMPGNTQYV